MISAENKSPPNEKLLERLKKLFALGQSSNQHEAELAMQKASELMAEHQISMAEVDLHDDGEITREDYVVPEGARSANWILVLANSCALLYDAKCHRTAIKGGVNLRFYGTPTDIALAKATFDYLHGSWKSIVVHDHRRAKSSEFGVTRAFKTSHLIGFSQAVRRRAEELASARQEQVRSATGRDLVLVKNAALDDYMDGISARSPRASAKVCSAGYAAGRERGNSIPLSGGLGAQTPLSITYARGSR